MQFRQDTTQQQTQVQRIGPHLIHANTLLQCTNTELLQMIEAEQLGNPALDGIDGLASGGDCPFCPFGSAIPCPMCPSQRVSHVVTESIHESEPEEDFRFMMDGGDDQDVSAPHQLVVHGEAVGERDGFSQPGDFDPVLVAAAPVSLAEQLVSHLKATANCQAEALISEYLVDCLDERGYLRLDVDEACAVLGVTPEDLDAGILRLQSCEPPGIGARNLRECLMLQMLHLRESDEESGYNSLAEAIVRDQWDLFTQRRYPRIGRRLGASADQVQRAVVFIRTQLSPHPASQFRQPWIHRPDSESGAIRPDVVVTRTPTGFKVELSGLDNLNLQMSPYYRGLYESIHERRAGNQATPPISRDMQEHVVEYVERAEMFLKNIQRRHWTIQRIATALVERQQGFIETGRRAFIRPLTRTQLASQLGMHESTISRALLHKYVQLPSQEVVSFDVFFRGGSSIKDAVASMVAAEDASSPLSDQAIAQALNDRGIAVARRTVVKYREELRIPASYLRRKR